MYYVSAKKKMKICKLLDIFFLHNINFLFYVFFLFILKITFNHEIFHSN